MIKQIAIKEKKFFDAPEWLAAMCSHLPDKKQPSPP